jgi:hypothetical protein
MRSLVVFALVLCAGVLSAPCVANNGFDMTVFSSPYSGGYTFNDLGTGFIYNFDVCKPVSCAQGDSAGVCQVVNPLTKIDCGETTNMVSTFNTTNKSYEIAYSGGRK